MVAGAGGESISYGIRAIADTKGIDVTSKALAQLGKTGGQTGKAIDAGMDQAAKSFAQVEQRADELDKSLERTRISAAAAGAAIGTLAGAASAAGQAHLKETNQLLALERAYGDSADQIDDLAQSYQDMGIASDDAVRIAALGAQSLAKNYGLTTDEIEALIDRSADLSQVTFDQYGNQLDLADVMQRVTAAIRGEAESAEVLGVALNDQRLAALAAAEGMTGWNTTMTDAEKAAFRMRIFLEDTVSAQGAAAEKSETLAGRVNALKLNFLDATASIGGFLGPVGEVASTLGGLAIAAPAAGAGLGKLAGSATAAKVATSALTIATGPVGLALAAGAAGLAIYELSTRQSEAEKQTKALKQATDDYTASLVSNTTALINAGAYDVTKGTEAFLNTWIENGLIAQQRIEDLTAVHNALMLDFQNPQISGTNVYDDLLESGAIDQYTRDVLAASDANRDGAISAEEYAVAQAMLQDGFALTRDQATQLTNVLNGIDDIVVNPDFAGAEIAAEADRIVKAMVAGTIEYQDGINQLLDLQDGVTATATYNLAQRQHEATQATQEGSAALVGSIQTINEHIAAIEAEEAALRAVAAAELDRQVASNNEAIQNRIDQSRANQEEYEAAIAATNAELERFSVRSTTAGQAVLDFAVRSGDAVTTVRDLTAEIEEAALALSTMPQDALESTFDIVVGQTDQIGNLVEGVIEWMDSLIGVEGEYAAIDDLLAKGLISQRRYDMAQRAYNRAAEDSADIQEDILTIQAKQAPLLARQVRDQERQLDLIAEMEPAAALAALGWMDAAAAQQQLTIQTQLGAAANTAYGSTARRAMEQYIAAIVATDPVQTAMLEQQGLIFRDQEGNWVINWDNADEINTSMDRLIESLDNLLVALEHTFNIDINQDGVIGVNENLDATREKLIEIGATAITADVSADTDGAMRDLNAVSSRLGEIDGQTADTYVNTWHRDFYERNNPFGGGSAGASAARNAQFAILGSSGAAAQQAIMAGTAGGSTVINNTTIQTTIGDINEASDAQKVQDIIFTALDRAVDRVRAATLAGG